MAEIEHPKPFADWETRAYWEGCGRGEIVLQRCGACSKVQHRPRALCASCLSGDIEHFVASGRGQVYTFTVTLQNNAPGFREACPYVLAYVELEEGPRLLTNVVGCAPDAVSIGMPVVADFTAPDRDLAVPRFRPA
ncbi:MAG: OB-fold domain-containing protein [Deltaproteobacteria bacterium]|nr:OB-fold domain-containing protein [Deltaproteobacteria bacterium]MBW2413475.1 OB-fold domain-containing protein [Deltaproteobacteria bacterium]